MDLLRTKYLLAGISYRGLQRQERLPVPEAALREAVLNALVHKDYSATTPIQISVYPGKLMVWNPGELPPHWTVARLTAKHPSQPFNPDVANAFFRAGLIEAWGRGIERIMEACRAAKLPRPRLRLETGGLWVEFSYRPVTLAPGPGREAGSVETSVEASVKTSVKVLRLLAQNPEMSLAQVAAAVGRSVRAVELATAKLVKAGHLRHLGPAKGGHWEVLPSAPSASPNDPPRTG